MSESKRTTSPVENVEILTPPVGVDVEPAAKGEAAMQGHGLRFRVQAKWPDGPPVLADKVLKINPAARQVDKVAEVEPVGVRGYDIPVTLLGSDPEKPVGRKKAFGRIVMAGNAMRPRLFVEIINEVGGAVTYFELEPVSLQVSAGEVNMSFNRK